jgi:hypothetical protein
MSQIIKISLTVGLIGLIGLATIMSITILVPAYDQYQIKQWLIKPVAIGFNATQKIDQYIAKYDGFPDITNVKELNMSGRELKSIAYLVPKADDTNSETGELHVVLSDTGIPTSLANQKIIFILGTDFKWQCTMTIDAKLRPDTCRNDAPPQPIYAG